MATLAVEGADLVVRLSWPEKIGGMHGDVRVPVRSVTVEDRPWGLIRGIRGPGAATGARAQRLDGDRAVRSGQAAKVIWVSGEDIPAKPTSSLQRLPDSSLGRVTRVEQRADSFRVEYEAHSASPEPPRCCL